MGAQAVRGTGVARFASRRLLPAILCGAIGVVSISSHTVQPNAARADEAGPAQIDAQLAAGEFGPARRAVEQVADPARRDAGLAAIAQAQAQSGARSASLATAAEIESDLTRAAALHEGHAGGNQADFDTLIDLIQSTVAPDTWGDAPGQGSIKEFPGGVLVDTAGLLRRSGPPKPVEGLAGLRLAALERGPNTEARRQSALRKVSLTRLEKQVQLRLAAGKPITEEMSLLAGLEKIRYVLVYPESGDVVLAGPADRWIAGDEGRTVAEVSGRPVLQLDDLVVILRHLTSAPDARFGCSITPNQEALKRTKAFLQTPAKASHSSGETKRWLEKVRAQLGRQDIDVYGIDPRTRVAQVLVEADYRMKLVGMGLEPGALGVRGYLESIELKPGETPPPLDVLRWWFTLNYEALRTTPARDAFELRGQGARVQSENEMISDQGDRRHTGQSSPLNQQFADSFTRHFPALAAKYPVYAELQNLFDVAMVVALIKSEGLADRASWHMTCFGREGEYRPALGVASTQVETVINHRLVNKTTVIAGASGGVTVDPWQWVRKESIKPDNYRLKQDRESAVPRDLPKAAWWWD